MKLKRGGGNEAGNGREDGGGYVNEEGMRGDGIIITHH